MNATLATSGSVEQPTDRRTKRHDQTAGHTEWSLQGNAGSRKLLVDDLLDLIPAHRSQTLSNQNQISNLNFCYVLYYVLVFLLYFTGKKKSLDSVWALGNSIFSACHWSFLELGGFLVFCEKKHETERQKIRLFVKDSKIFIAVRRGFASWAP